SYDAIRDLPLTVEECEFVGLDFTVGEFERLTTVITVRAANEEGVGEDVIYDPVDHIGQQSHGPPEGLAFSGTFDEFSKRLASDHPFSVACEDVAKRLDEIAVSPAGPPERAEVSADYRRWAYESAALDLALRQAGT